MRIFLFLFILIVTIGFCKGQINHLSLKENNLYIADSLYNFGSISNKKYIAHTYFLINNTNDTLQIDTVSASCDCLKIKYPTVPVLPKSKSNIIVQMATEDKSGEIEYYFQMRFKGDYASVHGLLKGTIVER